MFSKSDDRIVRSFDRKLDRALLMTAILMVLVAILFVKTFFG